MLFTKMNNVIDEINHVVAEREELIECIALALLSRKNLFILGDTGQAKSYCINEFRKRIVGAKQFERLISKQTDEEQLFGRLDLSSLIPGSMPQEELMEDEVYAECYAKLKKAYEKYRVDKQMSSLGEAVEIAKHLEMVKRIICCLDKPSPKINTEGKIPDSHIAFVDELFKANDGILNSLLTALNERVYTNEGKTVDIPVISFLSASNEIPNFKDSAQAILKPLYDRFDFKLLTSYVQEKENRMKVLKAKQSATPQCVTETITLAELEQMQQEVKNIRVPDKINELMDSVLCELRRNGVHVSDRKYFGFTPIVRAKAYLNGNKEVQARDLLVLKNYFWNTPEEIPTVGKVLFDLCENPVGAEVDKLLDMAYETYSEMENAMQEDDAELKPYIKFSRELLRIYTDLTNLRQPDSGDSETEEIARGEGVLEKLSEDADTLAHTTHIPMAERKRLNI